MPLESEEAVEELEPAAPAEGTLAVNLDDDDDDAPGAEPAAEPEGRRARRGRFVSGLKSELATEREARQRLENQIAELRGRVSAIRQPAYQAPAAESEPYAAEIDSYDAQLSGLLTQIRAPGITEEVAEKLADQYRKIDRQKRRLEIRQFNEMEKAISEPSARIERENEILNSEFPDITGDPIKLDEAALELKKLTHGPRKLPHNLATARIAAKLVQARYARTKPPLSASDASRFTAESGRASASAASSSTFTPSKNHISWARAYTSHREGLTDEQRVKIWAKEVGRPNKLI